MEEITTIHANKRSNNLRKKAIILLFSEEVRNGCGFLECLTDFCHISIVDLSFYLGHTASSNRKIRWKRTVHEIHFSTDGHLLVRMWTTNEEIHSFCIQISNRDIILRNFCCWILVIIVLNRGFDDGFEYEEIHSVW